MLKRLAGCVRQYKGASLLSPLFVVLEVIMEVIIPLLMAKLIDDGIDGANQVAILKTGFILVHNHPTGVLHPSKPDEELTKKIVGAGKILDIRLLDHLIISEDTYFSFADEGIIL